MLYKWMSTDDHSVKNFNKIFNLSKITGFDDEETVTIGEIKIGGLREVFIKDQTFLIELKSSNMQKFLGKNSKKPKKMSKRKQQVYDLIKKYGEIRTYKFFTEKTGMALQLAILYTKELENEGRVKIEKDKNITLIKFVE